MIAKNQSPTIAFLTDPKTYGVSAGDLATVETHISIVVLAGDRAFKLKRAVELPYVDFSTAELRLASCLREVELNRRTAPLLYRGVRRITIEGDDQLKFDGHGPLVDAVVEMTRFNQETLFDRLAQQSRLSAPLLSETARMIARFHESLPAEHSRAGSAIMADVLALNARAFAMSPLFHAEAVQRLDQSFLRGLEQHAPLVDAREKAGKVRRCHGDLHLRNICLLEGTPTLFDCIEFDDNLATIDVLYDLAFLVMDLWHRGQRAGANLVLNRYLDECNESDGLALLPFFMAVRATVRAHVTATQHDRISAGNRDALATQIQSYFRLANDLLEPALTGLVAIGGLSGSGKSTLAAALAAEVGAAPGARVLSSDRIRKRIYRVSAETRLPSDAYRAEVSESVYATQSREAAAILRSGHAVMADAVFDRAADRERIERCAKEAGVVFTGVWLEAPTELLLERVGARQNDASDATTEIVRAQASRIHEPIGWTRLPAAADVSTTAAQLDEIVRHSRR